MKTFLLAAAMGATALTGTAFAQDAPPPPPGAPMRHMERGPITRADALARADAHFARMDANQDGFITADELGGGRGGPAPQGGGFAQHMIERMDTNHDGKISRDEFRAEAAAGFDQADTNHDGTLDENEQAAQREQMRSRMEGMRGHWRGRGQGGGNSTPPPPPPPAPDSSQ